MDGLIIYDLEYVRGCFIHLKVLKYFNQKKKVLKYFLKNCIKNENESRYTHGYTTNLIENFGTKRMVIYIYSIFILLYFNFNSILILF